MYTCILVGLPTHTHTCTCTCIYVVQCTCECTCTLFNKYVHVYTVYNKLHISCRYLLLKTCWSIWKCSTSCGVRNVSNTISHTCGMNRRPTTDLCILYQVYMYMYMWYVEDECVEIMILCHISISLTVCFPLSLLPPLFPSTPSSPPPLLPSLPSLRALSCSSSVSLVNISHGPLHLSTSVLH